MSMPDAKVWTQGSIRGVTFTFHHVGSCIPLHSHPEGSAHFVFVREGCLLLTRPDPSKDMKLYPGAWIKIEPNEMHGYKALEAPSKITNITY